jgi:hypothetical protein
LIADGRLSHWCNGLGVGNKGRVASKVGLSLGRLWILRVSQSGLGGSRVHFAWKVGSFYLGIDSGFRKVVREARGSHTHNNQTNQTMETGCGFTGEKRRKAVEQNVNFMAEMRFFCVLTVGHFCVLVSI